MEESSNIKTFNALYNQYQKRFVRFANSYVRDIALAEDITMEAFMAYWENRESLRSESNIPGYMLTIVKNKCLNHLEHIKTKQKAISKLKEDAKWELDIRISSLKECDPEELLSDEIQVIINRTLSELPSRTRNVFIKSRYKNESHKAIAQELGITTKGVEFQISKALNAFRARLKDYLGTVSFFYLLDRFL